MTAKRFTINMEDECIDDAKNEIFIDFNDKIDFNQLCELLNELYDENLELKCKSQMTYERDAYKKLYEDLKEENEKLKSELDEIREERRKDFEIGNGWNYWE